MAAPREYFPIHCPTHGLLAEPRGQESIVWCPRCKDWYGMSGRVDWRNRKKPEKK